MELDLDLVSWGHDCADAHTAGPQLLGFFPGRPDHLGRSLFVKIVINYHMIRLGTLHSHALSLQLVIQVGYFSVCLQKLSF